VEPVKTLRRRTLAHRRPPPPHDHRARRGLRDAEGPCGRGQAAAGQTLRRQRS